MTTMETVFFNPVHLRIQLSDTPMHHPNAPGIPQSSSLVGFLLVRGYGVYATQDVFLRTLDDALPPAPTNASSLHVTAYDPDKYKDWDNLWSDLRNPHWEQAITQSLQDHPNRPILIVTDGSGIYGFAGPLYLDETGRGCFAGIGVHSSLRGQGLGKSLFEQLCRSFRDMGATYMSLFTGQENPAGRLYRKTGFRVVESFVNLRKTWSGLDGTNVRDSSERL
jgi:ribosomal protein S18 acetylase RimI-like enzyme